MTTEVISGPLSVRTMSGIRLARITQVTTARRKWLAVNLSNGSTFGTPKNVQ